MATKKYRVALETVLNVYVDVEVEYDETDEEQSSDSWLQEQAIDKAHEENGFSLCYQCGGTKHDNWGADVGEFEVSDKWGPNGKTNDPDVEEIA